MHGEEVSRCESKRICHIGSCDADIDAVDIGHGRTAGVYALRGTDHAPV